MEVTVGTFRFNRLTAFCAVLISAAVVTVASVSPAAAQFGAIRDAARRAADDAKKKAEEGKKPPDDAKKEQPAAAPVPPPAAPPAAAPVAAAANTAAPPAFETYSKFDFVPGEKIL